jgi:hypothetical protein
MPNVVDMYSLAKDILNAPNYRYLTFWVLYNTINNPRSKQAVSDKAVKAQLLNIFTTLPAIPFVNAPKS